MASFAARLHFHISWVSFRFIYVYECPACIHVCVTCANLLESLELGFRVLVSHHVSVGNWTFILCKSWKCSLLPSHRSRPLNTSPCRLTLLMQCLVEVAAAYTLTLFLAVRAMLWVCTTLCGVAMAFCSMILTRFKWVFFVLTLLRLKKESWMDVAF